MLSHRIKLESTARSHRGAIYTHSWYLLGFILVYRFQQLEV